MPNSSVSRALARSGFRALSGITLTFCCVVAPLQSSAYSFLSGAVTIDGKAVAGIDVRAIGNNATYHTKTNTRGAYTFAGLGTGTYVLEAQSGNDDAVAEVELGASGAQVPLHLTPLKDIGSSTYSSVAAIHGAGTDLSLTPQILTRSPAEGSLPGLLLQTPGAARGANGVVHINGDHGDINYIVDGVPIPQELNRSVGTEIDPNDIAYAQILEGAYPAQYGERFAAVVDIGSRASSGPAGYNGEVRVGSYGRVDSTIGYHVPAGHGGSFVTAIRNERSNRELDPPNFDSPNDRGSNGNQFFRLTLPTAKSDNINLTLIHSLQSFQIPPDVAGGAPAATGDSERQDDLFSSVQYRHEIGDHGSFVFGPSYKRSRIRDFGDPSHDFAAGINSNLAGGGASTDCAAGVIAACGFSLNGDRTAQDYRFNADYALRSRRHEIRAGGTYDVTSVAKIYNVTLQPNNYLGPMLAPNAPNAPYTVNDHSPNNGHTEEAYLQDSWKLGSTYQLDYGLRADSFQLRSDQFSDGAAMLSPRLKLTRIFTPRASAYAYYGRFFTPFSFENVSPQAAQTLNSPVQSQLATFDLKPERDSTYEIGGHVPLAGGALGARVLQKNATDLIDDTQVGTTNLHQDINYELGRIGSQSVYYQHGLPRSGRAYISLTHTYSVNKGCETQLLAPCFGSSTDFTPADHDQRYDINGGILANDRRNGWLSFNGEYGSGLSSAGCSPASDDCKFTPHLIFAVEKGIGVGNGSAVTLAISNLLNDRYLVTYLNAQGNHYAPPRTFEVGYRFANVTK